MKPTEAPDAVQAAIRNAIPQMLQVITEDLVSRANALDVEHSDELPASVTADDIALWLVRELREGIDVLTAWRIAIARQRGMTTARVAEDLGYLTGGNIRRRFPSAADIEAAYDRGDTSITVDGYTLSLDRL